VKKFYGASSLFIGVRGVVQENRLDMTVDSFLEDVCPLQRSEGDIFIRIQKFLWKRIVEVNPLPRGASVGEFGILHPRNVGFAEIREIPLG
jgi:hypothetical protein